MLSSTSMHLVVRYALGSVLLLTCLSQSCCLAAEPLLIVKPDAFETLVNPNCSHCIDEAKSRAGDLRARREGGERRRDEERSGERERTHEPYENTGRAGRASA